MTNEPRATAQKRILVFLPETAARMIVAKLSEHGYYAEAISSVLSLADALHLEHYSLAVTTRPEIDVIRDIKPIPVVNLEVFFHIVRSVDHLSRSSKKFDGEAFVARIKLLTEPRISTKSAFPGCENF